MKLLKKAIDKNKQGTISLQPEDSEDMWHLFNLIRKNDKLKSTTIRKIQSESTTGSTDSKRIKLTLTISVETLFFDTQVCTLRINGKVSEENEHVKLGAFHTIDLELFRNLSICKEEWDSLDFERIEEACDVNKKAEIAAVVMEDGLANICLLTESMTVVRQKVEHSIPKKRKGPSGTDKALEKFYEYCLQGLMKLDFSLLKVVILASPGFTKDKFYEYILSHSLQDSNFSKILQQNKEKFLLVHVSSGHKSALDEALKDETVQRKLALTKYAQETKALDSFFQMFNNDPFKAFYGKDVLKAHELGAISTLLITDKLFRADDVNERKKYVELVESVKGLGGEVFIFSSLHVTGEQLNQFTGLAAILKFPCPQIEEDD